MAETDKTGNLSESVQLADTPSSQKRRGASARRAAPQPSKSEVTKEKIYRASIELMARKGFQATTIRDICRQANVSVGTFYSYYESKHDVLKDLYLSADMFFYKFVACEITGKAFAEQLKVFVNYYAKLNTDTGLDMLRVLYTPQNEWFAQTRPMQSVLSRIITEGQASGEVRTDIEPQHITAYIFTTMRGVCYDWCINDGGFDMEKKMLAYLDIIVDGIKSSAAPETI